MGTMAQNDWKRFEQSQKKITTKMPRRTNNLGSKKQEVEDLKKAMLNLIRDLEEERTELSAAKAKEDALLASIGDGIIGTDQEGGGRGYERRGKEYSWLDRGGGYGQKSL